jgi:hypothetical protein
MTRSFLGQLPTKQRLTQKALPRRLFLRGAAGVTLSLPFLEAFAPRRARAQDQVHRYAIFIRQANGVQQGLDGEPERFWPSATGALTTASLAADFAADRTVGALSAYANKLLVVSGARYNFSTSGCGHADGGLQVLTAARPDGPNSNEALAQGESIDNRIVRGLEPAGSEPLNLYAGQKSGYLDDVLSYRGAGDRRAAENNPINAYTRLFGMPTGTEGDLSLLSLQRQSVNDVVREQMQSLMSRPELSQDDKAKLQLHFDAIRDLEVRMSCELESSRYDELAAVQEDTVDDNELIDSIVEMQMDIITLAVSCGLTHAVTLQIGNGNDQTQYTIDGVMQERFHHISHRVNSDGSDGTPIADADVKHHKIDLKFAGYFSYLLDKLSAYTTMTGSVLDEGVSVWLNDLANGPPHGSNNLPYVCAGSCGGFLKNGVYVDTDGATNNKVLSTFGAAVGVTKDNGDPLDDFGDPELEPGLISDMIA